MLIAHINDLLSIILAEVGDRYEEGETRARKALGAHIKLTGEESELTAFSRMRLVPILYYQGKYVEAEAHLTRARDFYDTWLPTTHSIRATPRFWLGRIRLEQQRPAEAAALFRESERLCGKACAARRRSAFLTCLGEAYLQLGETDTALQSLEMAVGLMDDVEKPRHFIQYATNILFADALRQVGRTEDARAALNIVNRSEADEFPRHPVRAAYLRMAGLLAMDSGDDQTAAANLALAQEILEGLLGPNHWRTQLATREFAKVNAGLRRTQ
jgi:tetratricopeptide (TPR) repeat protein